MNPSEMFRHCGDILNGEIAAVAPSIVIVMGEMVPLKKTVDANPGISWFSIDHPLTILNNPELKKPAWNTLKLVMSRMKELGIG
jgi:uracil-DNA glycosylase